MVYMKYYSIKSVFVFLSVTKVGLKPSFSYYYVLLYNFFNIAHMTQITDIIVVYKSYFYSYLFLFCWSSLQYYVS